MTLSLLHVNAQTGLVASLTATGSVAVGGYVHHVWRGLGGCLTQGLSTNPWYPRDVCQLLSNGDSSAQALDKVVTADEGRAARQCLVMDKNGDSAVFHGKDNLPSYAAIIYPQVAVLGNMLENQAVLTALMQGFLAETTNNAEAVLEAKENTPIFREDYQSRLLPALINGLDAAINAGGDYRGVVSAALRIESFNQAPIDLRVDYSEDVVTALKQLVEQFNSQSFQAFWQALPNR